MKKQYFCNPLNMDYRYQFIEDMRSGEDKISREAADPSMPSNAESMCFT